MIFQKNKLYGNYLLKCKFYQLHAYMYRKTYFSEIFTTKTAKQLHLFEVSFPHNLMNEFLQLDLIFHNNKIIKT